jgi:16S rRNA (cytosine1402-N4)-methyltransferase
MTFEREPGEDAVTAQIILNTWSEETIADILFGYGDERYARRIARKIVEVRKKEKIERTGQLVSLIETATPLPYHRGKTHFATRTFQALRIATNDELGAITEGLEGAIELLKAGGRCAVITFHSIEDRHVKQFFKAKADKEIVKLIVKKPIVPSPEEIKENPRSRSAKLRIVEKL